MSNHIKNLQEIVRERMHSYEEMQAIQLNLAAEANAASASVRRMYRDLAKAQARLEVAKECGNGGVPEIDGKELNRLRNALFSEV